MWTSFKFLMLKFNFLIRELVQIYFYIIEIFDFSFD